MIEKLPKSIYPNFRNEYVKSLIELWIKSLCIKLHFKELDDDLKENMQDYDIDEVQERVSYEVHWRLAEMTMKEIENIWKSHFSIKGEP